MTESPTPIERVLDLARWAPSGDNTQPWRFQIVGPHHAIVHGHDTRDHCVYDLQGHASQIALGALLETIHIAATGQGARARFARRLDRPEANPTFDVFLDPDADTRPDPLLPFVTQRVTQRRPFRAIPLTEAQRTALEAAVGRGYRVFWLATPAERWRMARLLFRSAHLRLTIPEAFETHRSIIQWHARYSPDRIPDQAVGMDPIGTRLMQWTLGSWRRVQFLNRYLAGTLLPRVQLDLLPGLGCAAHFALLADQPAEGVDDFVAAGRVVQRFWLTAASLGLQFQPEMTPLIFAGYARQGLRFSAAAHAAKEAESLADRLTALLGAAAVAHAVFMGRLGMGKPPRARSLRLGLDQLIQEAGR